MSEKPTPEQIQAFVDDLARLAVKHGLAIYGSNVRLGAVWSGLSGYLYYSDDDSSQLRPGRIAPADVSARPYGEPVGGDVVSIDISQLSAHERLEIVGGAA